MSHLNVNSWSIWAQMLLLGLGTFGLRLSFIHLNDLIERFPDKMKTVLEYLPAAILAALIFPELFTVESINLSSFLNIRSVAAGIALVISWYTEDMILTISGGMITLWLLNFLS